MKNWTDEWPSEPGSYWFHGLQYGHGKPRLCYVEVRQASNALMHITNGAFMYKEERHKGKWQKVTLPTLPQD